ncbi:MAG: VIT1/CCC1 transporter family protein [Bdellovibrionaceae bacterium]|nr:VIT1/CCC1 transporter family protein [Pseudobdellovibrionaceae bacterium]
MDDSLQRYLENWQGEVDGVAQYQAMADAESDPKIKAIYEDLKRVEERHMLFWEERIRGIGGTVPQRKTSWRARVLIGLAKRFGPEMILGTVAQNETLNRNAYARQKETAGTSMLHDEHQHAEILNQLARTQTAGVSGRILGRIEGRHKAFGGNALRASVLGANDGLCSNLCLVMGVAGASTENRTLILTGLAGLLAGAFSMALGEWLSVTSSRELAQREIRVEADELAMDPQSEAEEIRLIYESKGLSPKDAGDLAQHMIQNPKRAIDALTREELGLDPDDLSGSANEAALFSFVLFASGAIVPVLPFFALQGIPAIVSSLVLSGLALFGTGAMISVFTGRPVLFSGSRQLLLGGLAAGVTYGLGTLMGASL